MNSMLVRGQVHGGIAQGFGAVFTEQMLYEPGAGQLKNGSFMDYAMPRADALFDIVTSFHDVPCKTNPAGVNGAGEGGTVGSTTCLYSAALDALDGCAVGDLQMPLTPEKLWRAIANGSDRARSAAEPPVLVASQQPAAGNGAAAKLPLARLALYDVPRTAAGVFLALSIGINFANVVARYLLGFSIYWAEEAMVFLVIWSVCAAGIAIAFNNAHLNIPA
jgi:Molybdopterin-binding domain of aldehyde dehydrogenase/Tripartite ATP-independent periplasmic transporters, DctQ component